MYNIYTTRGIIIKIKESGESDKILSVFTKDFGRLEIFSKGTRKIKSKLRPHLDLFGLTRVSFITGREFFRLIDAEKIYSWSNLSKNKAKIEIISKCLFLFEKIICGQEENRILWNMILKAFLFLDKENLQKEELKIFYGIFIIRVLNFSGYINNSGETEKKLTLNNDFSIELLKSEANNLIRIFKIVKSGLKESALF